MTTSGPFFLITLLKYVMQDSYHALCHKFYNVTFNINGWLSSWIQVLIHVFSDRHLFTLMLRLVELTV